MVQISIKKEHRKQIKIIQDACRKYNVSFSNMTVESIIETFETGKFHKLIK